MEEEAGMPDGDVECVCDAPFFPDGAVPDATLVDALDVDAEALDSEAQDAAALEIADAEIVDAFVWDATVLDADTAGQGEVCLSGEGGEPMLGADAAPPISRSCAEGLLCCYPCGIPGCNSICTVPCEGEFCAGGCPVLGKPSQR